MLMCLFIVLWFFEINFLHHRIALKFMDFNNDCVICGQKLSLYPTGEVQAKGRQSMKRASIRREDNLSENFENIEHLVVHKSCQKSYTSEKKILTDIRKKRTAKEANLINDEPSPVKTRSSATYNLEHICLFCSESIPDNYNELQKKLAENRRRPISQVKSNDFRKSLLEILSSRNDKAGRDLWDVVCSNSDFVAAKVKYHRDCCAYFHRYKESPQVDQSDPEIQNAMNQIFDYLDVNNDCSYTYDDLLKIPTNKCINQKTLKRKLIEKYNDSIIVADVPGKKTTICFRKKGYSIINNSMCDNHKTNDESQCPDKHTEQLRIVQAAAKIIRSDIQSQSYDVSHYPSCQNYLNDPNSVIPDSLSCLLKGIILSQKKEPLKYEKQCTSIAHAIISATRPKSFISSILTSVGMYIYKKFESKILVNLLANLGFCATYTEVRTLETSAIMKSDVQISENSFSQFCFDNADFNSHTLDGFNTIHIMGGIQCITPASTVLPSPPISRINQMPPADTISSQSRVSIQTYEAPPGNEGIDNIILENQDTNLNYHHRENETMHVDDFLWLCGRIWRTGETVGWNGFNTNILRNASYEHEVSRVLYLPFINLPPSNLDTIYTSITVALQKCAELNQKTAILTFDQPLFVKARNIVQSLLLDNVVIRLGGFHLLMSYLGCFGFLMANSGLKEVMMTVYASISTDKMMTGHAFNRAVRAHSLIFEALVKIIFEQIDFPENLKLDIVNYLENSQLSETDIENWDDLKLLILKFETELDRLSETGPTAALWVQYIRMVILMKNFIRAERTANWYLHLRCVRNMIPYFFSCGHHLYAKSAQVYLQDMANLKNRMDPTEYSKFVTQGMFTVRRSDRFWAGIWSDMTIEQTLMRSMKAQGGLTHGRGVTESVMSRWTTAMLPTAEICESLEIFANIRPEFSEQHISIDERNSRILRDNEDIRKISTFFATHPPFLKTKTLISLSTGLSSANADCHQAYEKGNAAMMRAFGTKYGQVTVKKIDRVTTLASVFSTSSNQEITSTNPLALFNRLSIANNSETELKECFQYELSPIPLALFDENGMRKTQKSDVYQFFQKIANYERNDETVHVVDGGFLLRRVVWPVNENYRVICNAYVTYVTKHYGENSIVVFDGYSDTDTKKWERCRRYKSLSQDLDVELERTPPLSQKNFLTNVSNKESFTKMLASSLEKNKVRVIIAKGDADQLIISTAVSIMEENKTVVVVGEDVDLLIIMLALSPAEENLVLFKPGKSKYPNQHFSSYEIKKSYPEIESYILFFHGLSGCDTTSSVFHKGKTTFFNLFKTCPELREIGAFFKEPNLTRNELEEKGKIVFRHVYNLTTDDSLNDLRYRLFQSKAFHTADMLTSLPPTDEAAFQHILRVYCQIQLWLGRTVDPKKYGWRWDDVNKLHVPIMTSKPPAPEKLLQKIFCKCTSGCGSSCGCRKTGLRCSSKCSNCKGIDCLNVTLIQDSDNSDDEDF